MQTSESNTAAPVSQARSYPETRLNRRLVEANGRLLYRGYVLRADTTRDARAMLRELQREGPGWDEC